MNVVMNSVRGVPSCCVPDGTPCSAYASIFYRYLIPDGLLAFVRHCVFARHCGLDPQSPHLQRRIPNGMQVQRGENIVSTERYIPNGMSKRGVRRPVWDVISVESGMLPTRSRRPVMDGMKKLVIIVIIAVIPICLFSKCSSCEIKPPSPYSSIKIIYPAVYQINENGTEVDITLDIHSYIEDDAYLVLRVDKLCHQYSSNALSIYGGFEDSLKIAGFNVRSYSTFYHYNSIIDTDGSIVDYPMYIKKTSIRKGNNKEELKIVFPRTLSSINAQVRVQI